MKLFKLNSAFFLFLLFLFTSVKAQVTNDGNTYIMPDEGTGEDITACSGTLKDPGGDENYTNEIESTITIIPENASMVTLDFEKFNIERDFDQLYIYDGPDTRSPLIDNYTGNTLPEGGTITSSGGAITLMFNTDHSGVREGFELTWECTARDENTHQLPSEGVGETITACSGILQDDGGDLTYSNSSNGAVTIHAADVSSIVLDVYRVGFEEDDYLYIYDGSGTNGTLITTLSEASNEGVITTPGNVVTFHQVTNTSEKNQGFELSWSCVTYEEGADINMPSGGTGLDLTACSGTLKDPGGDENYTNGIESTITIIPENASMITLDFEKFNVERDFDHLYIYDGPDTSSPLIDAYTGNTIPEGGAITSSGEAVTLMFDTDHSGVREGFELTWVCDEVNSTTTLQERSPALSVYPNPATTQVSVSYENPGTNVSLTLFNETGKVVYGEQLQEASDASIDVSSFSTGIYVLQLQTDHKVMTKKLVIH